MSDDQGRQRAPDFVFLVSVLLVAQALGTMATSTLPAAVPKIAETYGVPSALIGYQISLLAASRGIVSRCWRGWRRSCSAPPCCVLRSPL